MKRPSPLVKPLLLGLTHKSNLLKLARYDLNSGLNAGCPIRAHTPQSLSSPVKFHLTFKPASPYPQPPQGGVRP